MGETLAENESGQTASVVSRQIRNGLAGFTPDQLQTLIVAYEPVWAIGTGRAATAQGANTVLADVIRPTLSSMFTPALALSMRILYGGSVTATNAAELFAQPDIDGGLVGGASLKSTDFVKIVKAAVH